MTFTETIVTELAALGQGKNCCRKALLFGLFYDAVADEAQKRQTIDGASYWGFDSSS